MLEKRIPTLERVVCRSDRIEWLEWFCGAAPVDFKYYDTIGTIDRR